MSKRNSVCSVILAGGQGRRVQGQDKGLLEYRGKPLVEHALTSVKTASQQLIVSCNRNLGDYQRLAHAANASVVADSDDSFTGPLAGILAASKVCQQTWLFTLPCDMPEIPDTILPRLIESTENKELDIAVCHDGERRQNLLMLVRHNVAETIADYLQSGGRRVDSWQNQFRVLEVDFSEQAGMFVNLNRMEDF